MKPRAMTTIVASIFLVPLVGCASQPGEPDPLEIAPQNVTFEVLDPAYSVSPFVRVPARFGQILFWIAGVHLWGPVAIGEDLARDDRRHPAAGAIGAAMGDVGGLLTGAPFLGLYWLTYGWWAEWVESDTADMGSAAEESTPSTKEESTPPPTSEAPAAEAESESGESKENSSSAPD